MNFPSNNGECKYSLSVILTNYKSVGYTFLFVHPSHTHVFSKDYWNSGRRQEFPFVTSILQSNSVRKCLNIYKECISLLKGPLAFQDFVAPRIFRQSAYEGDKVVSPAHRPPLPTGSHFCYRLSRPQSDSASGRTRCL
jgi:hypothetical protein